MTSEPGQGDTMSAMRYSVEPSSPLSSAPPSSPRKRSVTPTPDDSLPDTDATRKMSNLGLDGNNDPPPKKRTKLTPAEKAEREKEKEEKKREREEREREKARIKAEKEEQKKLKDEERVKKDLEKAAEKAKRDEEKIKRDEEKAKKEIERAKKEEEKAKKEEEKLKKERAQLRMDSFFTRKPPAASSSASAAPAPIAAPMKANEAVYRQPMPIQLPLAPALAPAPSIPDTEMVDGHVTLGTKTDYIKTFQPFFVRAGVTVAPSNRFWLDEVSIRNACQEMDMVLSKSTAESSDEMDIEDLARSQKTKVSGAGHDWTKMSDNRSPSSFKHLFLSSSSKYKRGKVPKFSTKQILAGLNSSPGPVPDFFGKRQSDNTDYAAQLQKLTRKILRYAEDVRPAYRGTFTKIPTTSGLRKGRNPFQQSLPGVQYDYDSEAEWVQEPDDDGEDIVSEEDEDPMEVGSADEMDDFLDDEEEVVKRKNNVAGPLIPAASGLMWDGECPKSEELMSFKIGILVEDATTPINPFSQEYWIKDKRKLIPQSRIAQLVPGPDEKGKTKVQGGNWWTTASQSSYNPGSVATSASGSTSQPTALSLQGDPPSQGPSGQADLRYGQDLPRPRNHLYGNFDRSSSATFLSNGKPYSSLVLNPTAKIVISQVEVNGIVLSLSSLANSKTAFMLRIPPDEHYGYFMLYHNLDYCGMTSYANLEKCHNFIVGNDATKVAMLEALKKMFNECTKPMLKFFMDTYCNRIGSSTDKRWKCVFQKDENSYWTLDLEVCKGIQPGYPAPVYVANQTGPLLQQP